VIFESHGPAGNTSFNEVIEALNRSEMRVHEFKTYRDGEKMLLVAKFAAGRTDKIMEEIFNAGLPKEITFYGYGSSQS